MKRYYVSLSICKKIDETETHSILDSRGRAVVARQAHNLEVVGSNPTPATAKSARRTSRHATLSEPREEKATRSLFLFSWPDKSFREPRDEFALANLFYGA